MNENSITQKVPYVCGPLTELSLIEAENAKRFYGEIADLAKEVLGVRAFVPHEHYDPILQTNFTPADVDAAERDQVCNKTSVLIVVTLAPSCGGGIEVEMAYRSGVPIILLCEKENLANRKISRLLRGNPSVRAILEYNDEQGALFQLHQELSKLSSS